MRYKFTSLALLLCSLQGGLVNADTIRGVNYDPVHSLEFARAVGLDDKQGMIDAINADLDKLAELQNNTRFKNIKYLKTFFTIYSSLGMNPAKRVDINMADVVNAWNMTHPQNAIKLALGVYEFRPNIDSCTDDAMCKAWSQVQVAAAIKAANDYPDLVDRIVVGNEDISDDASGIKIQKRVFDDIVTIKSQLNNKNIKLGTAQISDIVKAMVVDKKYADIKNAADFIGANPYPYWGGIEYGNDYKNSPVKQNYEAYWNLINKNKGNYEVIATEEGWPSAGYAVGKAQPNPDYAHDYLYYWYDRAAEVVPVSYLFALFDKTPGQGTESHWGIYSADGNASLLGAPGNPNDYSKPLADKHVLVDFVNVIGQGGGTPRVAAVNACTEDWNSNTKTQGACFPIDGYFRTGDVGKNDKRQLMIDATGKTYQSLLVVFYGDGGEAPRLCFVDKAALLKLTNKSQVILQWKVADGAVLCDVK